MGMWSSVIILIISIVLGRYIDYFGKSLFVYIQSLYAFFAPPFSAIFLLGILFKRINAKGATIAVFAGFAFGILMKVYIGFLAKKYGCVPAHWQWLEPYSMQGIINWGFCTITCVVVSLMTAPPAPEQVTDQLTFNWHKLNIFGELGTKWYSSVVLWWLIFVLIIVLLMLTFSGMFL